MMNKFCLIFLYGVSSASAFSLGSTSTSLCTPRKFGIVLPLAKRYSTTLRSEEVDVAGSESAEGEFWDDSAVAENNGEVIDLYIGNLDWGMFDISKIFVGFKTLISHTP